MTAGCLKERWTSFRFRPERRGKDHGGAEDRPDVSSARRGGAGFAGVSVAATGAGRARETVEYRIVRDFMEALDKRKLPEIARGLGLPSRKRRTAVKRIACLGTASRPRFLCRTTTAYFCRKFS